MHLAIDAVGQKQAGVASVLLEVLAAANESPRISKVSVLCSPRSLRTFDLPVSEKIAEFEEAIAETAVLRYWWYERGLPARVRQIDADTLLCLHSAGLSPTGLTHTTFVQRPLMYPQEARQRVPWRHRYRLPLIRVAAGRSCRRAGRVLVQTPSMGRSVTELFGLDAGRVEVVLPAPRKLPLSARPEPVLEIVRDTPPGRRLLFVGQLFSHKNVDTAIAALPLIREHLPDMRLFIAGPPTHGFATSDGVHYLGFIPDASLKEVYELATALIMPSLYETVGFPMLEAMSVGTSVIAADLPYAHEVCDGAALFFDPLDPAALAEKVRLLVQNADRRAELVDRGRAVVADRVAAKPYERMLNAAIDASGAG